MIPQPDDLNIPTPSPNIHTFLRSAVEVKGIELRIERFIKVREFSFNEPHQLDAGTYMKPDKTTLADFLAKWLVDYAKVKLSPRGFERYGDIVKQHLIPDFGEISLIKLKPEHLQKHYKACHAKRLSARTIRYHHAVIHKALQTALKWGLVISRFGGKLVTISHPR